MHVVPTLVHSVLLQLLYLQTGSDAYPCACLNAATRRVSSSTCWWLPALLTPVGVPSACLMAGTLLQFAH